MKILAVEDEVHLQRLLEVHLSREGWEVTFCETGEEALNWVEKERFDIVLLDWMLKGKLTGLEICKKISSKIPVLMITARSTPLDIVLGLEMGADDYLTKPFELSVLSARIRAVMRRSQLKSEMEGDTLILGDVEISKNRFEAKRNGVPLELTASEFKLLVAIASAKGKVLSRKRLLNQIQETGVTVVERIVDTHVYSLRKKIGVSSDHIETVRGVGYRVRA